MKIRAFYHTIIHNSVSTGTQYLSAHSTQPGMDRFLYLFIKRREKEVSVSKSFIPLCI